jgi:hypothetical protein
VSAALPSEDGGPGDERTSMNALRIAFVIVSATASFALRAESLEQAAPATETSASSVAPRLPAGRRVSGLLAALDIDHDGALSTTEMTYAPLALQALDLDGNGVLSADELRNRGARDITRATPVVVRTSTGPVWGAGFEVAFALDANHDGAIQAMEIANAASSLRSLDINGDGQITLNELRPSSPTALASL